MACANGAKKNEGSALGRQAEHGGQAINVDLCFVPWAHAAEGWLPAVSGSSGHLVVEHRAAEGPTRDWPGQVFQQLERSYEEAMQAYIQRTRDRLFKKKQSPRLPELAPPRWQKEMEARTTRHQLLQQRRQEDADWRAERQAHKRIVAAYCALSRKARAQQSGLWQPQKAHWSQRQQAR